MYVPQLYRISTKGIGTGKDIYFIVGFGNDEFEYSLNDFRKFEAHEGFTKLMEFQASDHKDYTAKEYETYLRDNGFDTLDGINKYARLECSIPLEIYVGLGYIEENKICPLYANFIDGSFQVGNDASSFRYDMSSSNLSAGKKVLNLTKGVDGSEEISIDEIIGDKTKFGFMNNEELKAFLDVIRIEIDTLNTELQTITTMLNVGNQDVMQNFSIATSSVQIVEEIQKKTTANMRA
jgi:hypothetical protein